MKCDECGGTIHWAPEGTETGGSWYHDDILDAWTCVAASVQPAR